MSTTFSRNLDDSLVLIFIFGFLTGYLSMTVEAKMMLNNELDHDMFEYVNFGQQYLFNPVMYGIIAVICAIVIRNVLPPPFHNYWTMGAAFGIIIPTVKLIDDYAIKVYKVDRTFLYSWDLMVYTLFWGLILQPMASYITS